MKRKNNITTISSIDDFLERTVNKEIIIFGAGNVGRHLLLALQEIDINPVTFWDNNADSIDDINGIPVISPLLNSTRDYSKFLFLIATAFYNTSEEITEQLAQVGIKDIISHPSDISAIIYHVCKTKNLSNSIEKCRVCPKFVIENGSCDIFTENFASTDSSGKNESLIIPNMGLSVTNLCSLRCKNCSETVEFHNPKYNFTPDLNTIIQDIKTFFNAVDFVGQIGIVGGESFIHKNLADIVSFLIKEYLNKKASTIVINTNGTVLPKSDDIFKLMSGDPKTYIRISDYRRFLNEQQQDRVKRFIDKLEEYNVSYFFTGRHWFDFGDFEYRGYSKEKVKEVYSSCICSEVALFNGKLYNCSRGVYGGLLYNIPELESDCVDLRTSCDSLTLRNQIATLISADYANACHYCNGVFGKKIPAGEQIER